VLQEYADEARLKQLVTKYSEFINFPIYLQVIVNVSINVISASD
jgi:HSP90 family molecular chaperone